VPREEEVKDNYQKETNDESSPKKSEDDFSSFVDVFVPKKTDY
jgi:hypothetical protein